MNNATPQTQTDAPSTIHPWEAAGLGKAPFRWLGVSRKVGPVRTVLADGTTLEQGAPGQPMGSCAFCGMGIAECHEIKGACGALFIVGCDCVRRVYAAGDRVLTQAETASRKLRNEAARARAACKAEQVEAELTRLLADEPTRARLAALPGPEFGTMLEHADWMARRAGATGRAKVLQTVQAALA